MESLWGKREERRMPLTFVSCGRTEVPPDEIREDRRRSWTPSAWEGQGGKGSEGGQAEPQGYQSQGLLSLPLVMSPMNLSGAQNAAVWEIIQSCRCSLLFL